MQSNPPVFPTLSIDGERDALLAPYRHAVGLLPGALALPGDESALRAPALRGHVQDRAEAWDAAFGTLGLRWAHGGTFSTTDAFLAALDQRRYLPAALRYADGANPHDGARLRAAAPLFAWAEYELYKVRGDKARLAHAFELCLADHRFRTSELRRRNGLYTGTAEGYQLHATGRFMLGGRIVPSLAQGASWVDASAMTALNARVLSEIARTLGRNHEAGELDWDLRDVASRMNTAMWAEDDGWYHDLDEHGSPLPMRTLAGLWPLLAGVAPRNRAERILTRLADATQFERAHPLSSIAASESDYRRRDGTPVAVVRPEFNVLAWECAFAFGRGLRAQRQCESHLRRVGKVLADSGDIYAAYDPDRDQPAPLADGGSGAGTPLACAMMVQQTLGCLFGLRPHGHKGELEISLHLEERHRVEGLPFLLGTLNFEVSAAPASGGRRTIEMMCDLPLKLRVRKGEQSQLHELHPGMHTIQA